MKFSSPQFLEVAQKHMFAIVVGVTIALIVVSPHIRAWYIVGPENFEGVYPVFHDDEITYQARIKEVLEGNFNIGNPYIKEHKDDPFIMPPIAEALMAGVAFLTNTSVPFVTSASDIVLTCIGFLLVYILFLQLTRRHTGIALLYTTLFFIFSLNTFGRPISPQLNALFLFGGIIVITRAFFSTEHTDKKSNRIAGLVTGFACFISPYYFTALLTLYGTLITIEAFFERSKDALKRRVGWFTSMFIPFALLYAFFHLSAAGQPFYEETMLRYGVMHTHIPGSFTNMMFGIVTLTVLLASKLFLSKKDFIYGLGAVMSIFMLNWQNIITGTSLQFSSHYLFTTILLVLMVLAVIHTSHRETTLVGKYWWVKAGTSVGIVFILLVIGENQKNEFLHIVEMPYSVEELTTMQKKMEVFTWFNNNTVPDSVVYTLGDTYDFLLPVYTNNRVYYNFYAALYPASHTETEERWLIQHLFDADMSTSTLREHQREYWGNRFIDIYQSTENRKKIWAWLTGGEYQASEMIDESHIEYMFARWNKISKRPVEESLRKYEVDYILLSRQYPNFTSAKARLESVRSVSLVASLGAVEIYSIE